MVTMQQIIPLLMSASVLKLDPYMNFFGVRSMNWIFNKIPNAEYYQIQIFGYNPNSGNWQLSQNYVRSPSQINDFPGTGGKKVGGSWSAGTVFTRAYFRVKVRIDDTWGDFEYSPTYTISANE